MKWVVYRVVEYRNGHGNIIYVPQKKYVFFWFKCRFFGLGTDVVQYISYQEALNYIDKILQVKIGKKMTKRRTYKFIDPEIPEHIPKSQIDDYLKSKEERNG